MATWGDFSTEQPEVAGWSRRILAKYGLAYLATLRFDGSPRIHPVCPIIAGGQLCVGLIRNSPKRADLDRDGRFSLHCLPGPRNAEILLTGTAHRLTSNEVAALQKSAETNQLISDEPFWYRLDLGAVQWVTYDNKLKGRPLPTRASWQGVAS